MIPVARSRCQSHDTPAGGRIIVRIRRLWDEGTSVLKPARRTSLARCAPSWRVGQHAEHLLPQALTVAQLIWRVVCQPGRVDFSQRRLVRV
jgi:hypothetical protein